MTNLTEVANFDATVYQIATGDAVLGGPGGIANLQAQALADRTQWLKAQITATQAGGYWKGTDTGAANAYVVALNPAITQYGDGQPCVFRAAHANTTGCTLNAGGGVVALLREDGQQLINGDIAAGSLVFSVYDLATNAFLVVGVMPSQVVGGYGFAYQTGFIL